MPVVFRALCYLSVKQYRDAVRDCSEALRMDGGSVKALYRRAQAHKELKVRAANLFLAGLKFQSGEEKLLTVGPAVISRNQDVMIHWLLLQMN